MARNPKTRFIPTGSKEKTYKAIPGVVVHLCKDGVSAIGYSGKSNRPDFYFKFMSAARRDEYIKNYFDKKKKELKEKEARAKAAASFKHNLKVGDIVYNSWGYEQTNIDFYEVIAVPSGKTIKIRELKNSTTENGFMCGSTVPKKGDYRSDRVILKKVKPGYSGKDSVCIPFAFGVGDIWDGNPKSCSWYA